MAQMLKHSRIRSLRSSVVTLRQKIEDFRTAVALHYAYYNFVKIHKTIRCTPAMEAGVTTSRAHLDTPTKIRCRDSGAGVPPALSQIPTAAGGTAAPLRW